MNKPYSLRNARVDRTSAEALDEVDVVLVVRCKMLEVLPLLAMFVDAGDAASPLVHHAPQGARGSRSI